VAALQARHATALRSYALELTRGDHARADEALVALWRDLPPSAVATDAGEVPPELLYAALRRKATVARRGTDTWDDAAGEDAAEEPSESPAARVARRFRQLTPKQQEALHLRLRHGFRDEEIAHITEISVPAAGQLVQHALSRLQGGGLVDSRLARLAWNGATPAELANETPVDRGRVAELRTTIEITRQVLQRGVEHYGKTPRARRRAWMGWALGVVAVAGALVGGIFLWNAKRGARADDVSEAGRASGRTTVAIRRTAAETAEKSRVAAGSGEGAAGVAGMARPAHASTKPERADAVAKHEAPGASAERNFAAEKGAVETEPTGNAEPEAQASGAAEPGEVRASAAGREGREEKERVAEPVRTTAAPVSSEVEVVRAKTESAAETWKKGEAREATAPIGAPRAKAENFRRAATPSQRVLPTTLDTAPIAALRRALEASRWPERSAVSVRAFLNSVPPSGRPPRSDGPVFSAKVESSAAPGHPERRLVRVALRARENAPTTRAPATVILLLDVSGSMDAPNRLPLVQDAVAALLRRLRPEDRVGVVTYAGESRVLLPPMPLAKEREIRAAVEALTAKGRTNGGAGLREAFALAATEQRAAGERVVILCTDGDFNMGETSEAELGALVERERAESVRLAIFGFGRAERIDARLEALAARAQGGSGYVNTRAEAEQALVGQLDGLFGPVAQRLDVAVEFDAQRVARYRAVGDAKWRGVAEGRAVVAARERVLPGEEVTALLEVEPVASAGNESAIGKVRATFHETGATAAAPVHVSWPVSGGAGELAGASVDFRFAAALAAFGEVLQEGPRADSADRLAEIEGWARNALGEDAGGYRAEILELIAQAKRAAR
jgi:Ca-activated chloride channel family protein